MQVILQEKLEIFNMKIDFVNLKRQYNNYKTEIDSAIEKVINETDFINGIDVKSFENNFKIKIK